MTFSAFFENRSFKTLSEKMRQSVPNKSPIAAFRYIELSVISLTRLFEFSLPASRAMSIDAPKPKPKYTTCNISVIVVAALAALIASLPVTRPKMTLLMRPTNVKRSFSENAGIARLLTSE